MLLAVLIATGWMQVAVPPPAERRPAILAVFAHPDDEEIVGPLLAAYARRGVRVQLAIVTDGEKGVAPHSGLTAGPELARVRAEEARCACRALGIDAPLLLGFKDGELGRIARPPWGPLADVQARLAELLARVRPEAVITFGPEGGYGHPDHRLVGAVVTQLVEAGAEGAPSRLYYPGFPKDRMPTTPLREGDPPWSPTDARFLTVRVPYAPADLAATRAALGCHKSQFPPEQIGPLAGFLDQVLGGRVYLRPWFGDAAGDDVLTLPSK